MVYHTIQLLITKQAAFARNGHAKAVLGLSKSESNKLWEALQFR